MRKRGKNLDEEVMKRRTETQRMNQPNVSIGKTNK
jgi:hypothetical protein